MALLGGIAQLGRSLGLELVAEGVELEVQAEVAGQAGCDLAQGYLFSRPLAPELAEAMFRDRVVGRRRRAALRSVGSTSRTA